MRDTIREDPPATSEQALRQLRHRVRADRRALSAPERRRLSRRVVGHLTGLRLFRGAQRIACYLPNDGEIDLIPLIERMDAMGKRCFLPVLDTLRPRRLWFASYRPGDALTNNRYGIPEPSSPACRRLAAWHLDLVITPLVAFDDEGRRLGMGGGYYDRTLSFLNRRRHWRRPRLVGVAYEFQRTAALPHRPWDIPLNSVVTEACVRHFR